MSTRYQIGLPGQPASFTLSDTRAFARWPRPCPGPLLGR